MPLRVAGMDRLGPSQEARTDVPDGSVVLAATAYCLTGGTASGLDAAVGIVAANAWPLGTSLIVSDSPWGPSTFLVADRIGHGSSLDFAMPGDCAGAIRWGRRTVSVAVAGP